MPMTPFEIKQAKKDIERLKEDIACAQQELQFSGFKDQIREYIQNKKLEIERLEKLLKNA